MTRLKFNRILNTSFSTIYINPVITVIYIKVGLGGVRVALGYLVYVGRVVQKLESV